MVMRAMLPALNLDPPAACALCDAPAPPLLGWRDFADSCNDAFLAPGERTFPRCGVALPYHRCARCGLLFTAALDGWDAAAFRAHIYNDDYLRADPPFVSERPTRNAHMVAGLWHHEKGRSTVLDFGGGAGTFAAALRALGLSCDSCDAFYGAPPPARRYPIITSFEVIEHTPHHGQRAWLAELAAHLEPGGVVLLSTALLPADAPIDHWYIGPRNGHISIHSERSLQLLARGCGLQLVSLNSQTHLLR